MSAPKNFRQMNNKELQSAARAELEIFGNNTNAYTFTIMELLQIIGQLQLALRHPKNHGPSTQAARYFIGWADGHLVGQPALREVIRRGFEPSQDEAE